MKHVFFALLFILLAVCAVQAATAPVVSDREVQQVVRGNNEFALNLYKELAEPEKNLFFSPYSVSTALAMTYAGAKGETEKSMRQTLRFPFGGEPLNKAFGIIIWDINNGAKSGNYTLFTANRLWPAGSEKIQPAFVRTARMCYQAGVQPLSYRTDLETARQIINRWVEQQTNNHIKELVPREGVNPATVMVLTNAIYFMGNWESQFDEKSTRERDFYVSAARQVKAPMMLQKGTFRYMETNSVQLVELPYKGGDLSMVIVLPQDNDGLAALEKTLTTDVLTGWMGQMKPVSIVVSIPKFKISSGFSLANVLKAMGMQNVFGPVADFSGIAQRIFISQVFHQAYVDVNERGTEAAAATAVVMTRNGGDSFVADHPFMFLIKDNKKGNILFMGQVVNPVGK